MRSAFAKDIIRSIRGSLGRFLAIMGIVALGCGFYAGLQMCGPNMRADADALYDGTNLWDIRLISTLGFGEADVERVRAVAACEALMHAAAGGDASAVAAAQAALAALDAGQQAMVSASAAADLQKGEAVIEKAKQEAAAAEKAKQEAAEKARKEDAEKATNVANATVTVGAAAYTGKARTPSVKVVLGGRTLKEGTDYTFAWSNNVKAGKSAKVTVKGKGAYHGSKSVDFAISAAKNSVTVKNKAVTKKLKASKKTGKLAAKKTFKLKSLVKATSKFGALTFAKKKGSASIKVSKSGKITAKKGLKRGTYTVKVKVSVAKTANWSAASKTVTVKVVVQ